MTQRFTAVVVLYFVMGAVVWGGGAVSWDNIGLPSVLLDEPAQGQVAPNEETKGKVENLGGPIQQAAATFAAPIVAIWNIIKGLITFMFWPIVILASNQAPARVIIIFGGIPVVGFYGSILRMVKSSG